MRPMASSSKDIRAARRPRGRGEDGGRFDFAADVFVVD
jgi:hypothetical protein